MKIKQYIISSSVVLIIILLFSVQARADLTLLGQGTSADGTYNLIYDTDLDITWFDYTNSVTTWDNQISWADQLSVTFGGTTLDNWRLPITPDGPYADGVTYSGIYHTDSELGHLFYTEFGNDAYRNGSGYTGCGLQGQPTCLSNTGEFQSLNSGRYWSTDHAGVDYYAWYFDTDSGYQYVASKNNGYYAIAVMDGMAVAPEPISSILFLTGGTTLGFRRFRRKFKK